MKFNTFLESFFQLKEHGTSIKKEALAGMTTFMTMAYIIFVNPDLLKQGGMNTAGALFDDALVYTSVNDPVVAAVVTVTILSAAIATIAMGLLTNYPFALASGMGLNAFFAFTLAPEYGWQAALSAVFISGFLFFLLTAAGWITIIERAIPQNLKNATAAGIGLFIALIGFTNGDIIISDPNTLVGIGSFADHGTLLAIGGLLLTAGLMSLNVRGAILIGILISAIAANILGIIPPPQQLSDLVSLPSSIAPIALELDFRDALNMGIIVIFTLLFVDIFDSMGTLVGTGERAGLLDEKGSLPKIRNAMFADSGSSMLGSMLGTSTVTTYVESTTGIAEGGRTGLTSIFVGLFFLLTLFLTPLTGYVPTQATAPALIIVGSMMMGSVKNIDFNDFTEAFPAFVTIAFMPFAFSISEGIAAGFITYPLVKILAGRHEEVHWILYPLAIISIIHFWV
ncbi:MAG: NCS2 family permease [Balneolales bacterium]